MIRCRFWAVVLLVPSCWAQTSHDKGVLPATVEPAAYVRPSLKEFHFDLLRNFRALASPENTLPFFIGGVAAGAWSLEDEDVERVLAERNKSIFSEGGDAAGNGLLLGSTIGGMLLVSRTTDNPKFQSFTYSLAQGFVVNQTTTLAIKASVSRHRPDRRNTNSFPSGHTSNSFTWATIADHYYGKKVGIPAYVMASYVAWSRVDDKSHHLSDVIAGAALGYIVGKTVLRNTNSRRRVQWNVGPAPGGGFGASVQISLARR